MTRSVKLNEPVLVGVPEILPFEALRSSPGGNDAAGHPPDKRPDASRDRYGLVVSHVE